MVKFLFDACIFKRGLLSSLKTGAQNGLVVSVKERSIITIDLFLELGAKSYVSFY
jgi:hypothetical protein